MAISGDTAIIGSPGDGDMGYSSGSVYVFVIRYYGAWEELQKLTPLYGKADD